MLAELWEGVMSFSEILLYIFLLGNLVFLVMFFVAFAGSAKSKPELTSKGQKKIRPSKTLLWGGLIFLLWAIFGLYLGFDAIFRERIIASSVLVSVMVTLVFGLMAVWILARYFRFSIIWDDEKIEVINWRKEKEIYLWTNLIEVSQRNKNNTVRDPIYPSATPVRIFDIALRFKNDAIVRAAPNLSGYYGFVEDVLKKWEKLEKRNSLLKK